MKLSTRLRINAGVSLSVLLLMLPLLFWLVAEVRSARINYEIASALNVATFEQSSARAEYLLFQEDRAREDRAAQNVVIAAQLERAKKMFRAPEELHLIKKMEGLHFS